MQTTNPKTMNQKPRQLPLGLPTDPALLEELVLAKARELYGRSRFLSGRYASFNKLMADPVAGRCMRLSASQLLRLGSRTQGR